MGVRDWWRRRVPFYGSCPSCGHDWQERPGSQYVSEESACKRMRLRTRMDDGNDGRTVRVRWLDVGFGFGPEDSEEDGLRFLRHLNITADLIQASGEASLRRRDSYIQYLNLMCQQDREAGEPTIELF